MKTLRFIFALAFVVAAIWVGAYSQSELPQFHWAKFPTILTACLVAACGAVLIGAGLIDAPLRVIRAGIERVRRFAIEIISGTSNGGPYRVISLRGEVEVARFIVAADALEWAAQRRRMEGPHGPVYEVRNVYGDRVTSPHRCMPCEGEGKVPLNSFQLTTCDSCSGLGLADTSAPRKCPA